MTDHVRAEFGRLLAEIRPKLHRYCARMVGSAIDGEDIVQDAMINALDALATVGTIDNAAGWLFRIAHNTALDSLRRHAREPLMSPAEDLTMIAADEPPDCRYESTHLSGPPCPATQRRDPQGCARTFNRRDFVDHWGEPRCGEIGTTKRESSPTAARS